MTSRDDHTDEHVDATVRRALTAIGGARADLDILPTEQDERLVHIDNELHEASRLLWTLTR